MEGDGSNDSGHSRNREGSAGARGLIEMGHIRQVKTGP